MSEDEVQQLKAQLTRLLSDEATALHRAITLSQSNAPQSEVSAAIRLAEKIRRDRLAVASQLAVEAS